MRLGWAVVVTSAAGCGRAAFEPIDTSVDAGIDAAAVTPCVVFDEPFNFYASTSDPDFVALWATATSGAGSTITLSNGDIVLDDVNQPNTAKTLIRTRQTFGRDCDVSISPQGETQCTGPMMRGYAVVGIELRDPATSAIVGWEMPWACAETGDPPQRIYTETGDVWTDPLRDQAYHSIDFIVRGSQVTAFVDGVERVAFPHNLSAFQIELSCQSQATLGYPAACRFDGADTTPPP